MGLGLASRSGYGPCHPAACMTVTWGQPPALLETEEKSFSLWGPSGGLGRMFYCMGAESLLIVLDTWGVCSVGFFF